MGARQKLNRLAFLGCVGAAAGIGVAAQSWWVFGIVLAVTLAASVANAEIRLGLARRRGWRRPSVR